MLSIKQLMNYKVIAPRGRKQKEKRVGKVRRFVFHPREKRCIGFIVKRPDAALMFKRKDLFVAIDRITVDDEAKEVNVAGGEDSTGAGAIDRFGVEWDNCVLWLGMQVVAENGEVLGEVGNVLFEEGTGKVDAIELDNGATARLLLGKSSIPASMIKGFRFGVGSRLSGYQEEVAEDEDGDEELQEQDLGAILVSNEALDLEAEGGLAEKAGRASVNMQVKGREFADKAKEKGAEVAQKAQAKTAEAVEQAKAQHAEARPQMQEAGKKAEEAVNKGAYLTGVQLGKARGMFANFMDEYHKALNGDDDKGASSGKE